MSPVRLEALDGRRYCEKCNSTVEDAWLVEGSDSSRVLCTKHLPGVGDELRVLMSERDRLKTKLGREIVDTVMHGSQEEYDHVKRMLDDMRRRANE